VLHQYTARFPAPLLNRKTSRNVLPAAVGSPGLAPKLLQRKYQYLAVAATGLATRKPGNPAGNLGTAAARV